ncbi:hypothetical protein [Citrobacter portucalensis]|uniref:hypothetical protein n=1 Tax=Citrobacter portucalensis TaxID=1639133 RepID=UPI00177B3864|nr:hypothetical protein [Citrobacter portucalensis]MBD9984575.1 hypothetical protein [Citrobacter portucalensis]MBE0031847.1 hypothetical protein [Citrobacter portucalensis]MBE0039868.1 hypothetical protein [Citrobacter portucalensis]MBE0046822.1 hypothetical protein [Citrobacter portucalensis]MBE0076443.1 hypothetical protein [Citrobacter portucalensis]
MTTNHPAHGPVSLDRLHQIREILSKAAAQSDGGNLGYAMADAVKVIDGAIAAFGAEPAAIVPVMYKGIELLKKDGLELIRDGIAEATELESMCMAKALLSARPAPVVPEWTNEQCLEFLSIAFRHAEIKGDLELDDIRLGMKMVNESRAVMLKAGNHTEKHLDMVDHSGDANKMVAGNSPVTPDDVLRMDWLVSKTVDVREPMVYGSHSIFWSQTITDEDDDYHATKLREQIDAAMAAEQAAAPQQEVKAALEHGMQRYAGAMTKLSEGDE